MFEMKIITSMNLGEPGDLILSKKQFIFEHSSDNIREDYLIGKILGTGKQLFDFLNKIGAFGEVRLCTHRKTGAKRAVKIIKKSFLKGKEEVRFLSEIEILKTMVPLDNDLLFILTYRIIQLSSDYLKFIRIQSDIS